MFNQLINFLTNLDASTIIRVMALFAVSGALFVIYIIVKELK